MQVPSIRRALLLIQISRPLMWPVLPLVYSLGLNAAQADVGPAVYFQALLLTFPMNLIGCGLNDIYDVESDRLSARRRAVWAAAVHDSERPFLLAVAASMAPLIVFSAWLTGNSDNIVATVSMLLVAWAYSVAPVRLKERPPLDSLSNGLGYFLLPFVMGYSLGADPRGMAPKYYLLALCVCGIHALATAADYHADRAAGHRTLAVAFGRRAATTVAFGTFFVTWLLGDFHGTSVRAFIALGTIATFISALFPKERVITTSCVIIFVGFLLAAISHIVGW